MKIAICQLNIKNENKAANKIKILQLAKKYLSKTKIDWLLFPEMCLTGFSMNKKLTKSTTDDKQFFINLAKKYKTAVTYGAVENGYNKSITLNKQGKLINQQPKMHLYPAGENKTYKSGKTQKSFKLNGFNIIPCVCYDLRFSYLFWNKAQNTDIYLVIALWPSVRIGHWDLLLRSRAVDNQAYVIGVGRIGKDVSYNTCGHSAIYDPFGNELLNCKNKEGIFICKIKISKNKVKNIRKKLPFLKSRKQTF
jgi:predicted amidohydrolase